MERNSLKNELIKILNLLTKRDASDLLHAISEGRIVEQIHVSGDSASEICNLCVELSEHGVQNDGSFVVWVNVNDGKRIEFGCLTVSPTGFIASGEEFRSFGKD